MEQAINIAILLIEGLGAALIIGAVLLSGGEFAVTTLGKRALAVDTTALRLRLAQRLVFGLEFLIAADILKTVGTPTWDGVALLGAIVAVRTVLSLSIAYELRGPNQLASRPPETES